MIRRFLLAAGATLAAFALLVALGIFLPWPFPAGAEGEPTVTIFVATNGVHTDVVMPVRTQRIDWSKELPFPGAEWISFGWGERDFYLNAPDWGEVTVEDVTNALFFSKASLMHVGWSAKTPTEGEEVRRLTLSAEAYDKLVTFVEASFAVDAAGHYVRVADGYTKDDAFYASTGHYSLRRTCNSWTVEALRQAGVETPLWGGTAFAVMWHVPES